MCSEHAIHVFRFSINLRYYIENGKAHEKDKLWSHIRAIFTGCLSLCFLLTHTFGEFYISSREICDTAHLQVVKTWTQTIVIEVTYQHHERFLKKNLSCSRPEFNKTVSSSPFLLHSGNCSSLSFNHQQRVTLIKSTLYIQDEIWIFERDY